MIRSTATGRFLAVEPWDDPDVDPVGPLPAGFEVPAPELVGAPPGEALGGIFLRAPAAALAGAAGGRESDGNRYRHGPRRCPTKCSAERQGLAAGMQPDFHGRNSRPELPRTPEGMRGPTSGPGGGPGRS